MKLTMKQYEELNAARDEHLQEKLTKYSRQFLNPKVWKYGSAVDIIGSKYGERGLLIFIPYEFRQDFGL